MHLSFLLTVDAYDEYDVNDRHLDLEDMFFGMKDINFDDISDQEMADSINNIGAMVLANSGESVNKNYSKDSKRAKYKPDR